MADSRLRRFVGGLGLGYIHTIVTVIVGLWLTPYLLRHLGSHDYGLWLLGAQVLVYLSLMDLGIVQLVPRDVAIAAGRASGDPSELKAIVGQTARLVLWQVPPVALIGSLVVVFLPAEWAPLRWPLAIVIVAFVVSFPLRMFNAVLQGLQDLAFLGTLQLAAWAAGAAITIAGVTGGLGLYSLSAGWITTQFVSAIVGWRRLVNAHGHVLPGAFAGVDLVGGEAAARHGRMDQRQPNRAGASRRHRSRRDWQAPRSGSRRAVHVHGQAADDARQSAADVHADGAAGAE